MSNFVGIRIKFSDFSLISKVSINIQNILYNNLHNRPGSQRAVSYH